MVAKDNTFKDDPSGHSTPEAVNQAVDADSPVKLAEANEMMDAVEGNIEEQIEQTKAQNDHEIAPDLEALKKEQAEKKKELEQAKEEVTQEKAEVKEPEEKKADRYANKSVEDIIEMHKNAQAQLTKLSQKEKEYQTQIKELEEVNTKIEEVSDIGTGDKNNVDKVDDGKYPFFVRSNTVERINSFSYDGEAILVPGEGGIGKIFHYINGKFDFHQRVYKISSFTPEIFGKYVYWYMVQCFSDQAVKHSVKATVDSLRLPTFKEFVIEAPSLDEQKAITKIVDDISNELTEYEKRKNKVEVIKKGLMQELLTGKTRLV